MADGRALRDHCRAPQHCDTVIPALAERLSGDTTERWVGRLAPLGIVVAGVEALEQALASEQVAHREMVVTITTAAGRLRAVGNPIKIVAQPTVCGPPPLLGEHNDWRAAAGAAGPIGRPEPIA